MPPALLRAAAPVGPPQQKHRLEWLSALPLLPPRQLQPLQLSLTAQQGLSVPAPPAACAAPASGPPSAQDRAPHHLLQPLLSWTLALLLLLRHLAWGRGAECMGRRQGQAKVSRG